METATERTAAQSEASRLNGTKSLGPVTGVGKSVSAMNGIAHGLASRGVLLPSERHEDYQATAQSWLDTLRPASPAEATITLTLADLAFRTDRLARLEEMLVTKAIEAKLKDSAKMKAITAANPASEIEYPKVGYRLPKAILNHAEVEQVFAVPDISTPMGLRDRAVLEVLYSTGIRRMELEGVLVSDIDFSHGTLFIRKGKGDKDRVVPIGERALAWVTKYLEDARPGLHVDSKVQALFLDKNGQPMSKRALTWMGHKYMRKAKTGKPGSVHVFRHSMATEMLNGGADTRYIQAMLGHSSLMSTQIYTKVAIGKLKAVHDATHPSAKMKRKSRGKKQAPAVPDVPEDLE